MTENELISKLKIQVGGLPSGSQITPEMSAEDFIDATPEKLESIALAVDVAIQPFMQKLSKLKEKPSEVTLEFGVNVGGEVGVPFVTKGTFGANFKISIKWKCEA